MLGDVDFHVYGSARYAGAPCEPWGSQAWIGYDDDLAGTPEAGWLREISPDPRPLLRTRNVGTLARACHDGPGLALLPSLVAGPHGLERLSEKAELRRELWPLAHRDAARLRRYRVVADWLVATIAAAARRFV